MPRVTQILQRARKSIQDLDLLKILESELNHELSSLRYQVNFPKLFFFLFFLYVNLTVIGLEILRSFDFENHSFVGEFFFFF